MPVDPKSTAKIRPFDVIEQPGPDYRPTGQMPIAVRNERLLEALIEQGKETRDTLQTVVDGQVAIVTRLGRLEASAEERARKHSGGIKRVSSENEDQNAAIATLVVDVTALKETNKTQLAILERLDKVAANPMVRRVAYAVAVAVLGYFAATGRR